MKNCKQCEECIAESICANWVTPIAKVCSNFLEAVDALKTAHNSAMDEIAERLSATKGATVSDQNIIDIAVIKLRQLRQ